jgi:hypothetical protein
MHQLGIEAGLPDIAGSQHLASSREAFDPDRRRSVTRQVLRGARGRLVRRMTA